ncbi:rhodanese-like domain-containing protein [Desulfonatronovibrio hydrogenovorans]|uniref:rhodanese-like domain-containing protein n=1 Tax=Desulfonatronovibrio hydrogenovorans TaxID=53245 RepID=UPI00048AD92B|nr:rhodanese-like domain-containing protein [Desulfonatronovibrio hydrogenovorans]
MKITLKNFMPLLFIPALIILFLAGCTAKEGPRTTYDSGKIPTVDVEFDPTQVPKPFHTIVGIDFVKPIVCDNLLLQEPRTDVLLIDSRPKRPRYDRGHIPSAISIPDSQFSEMTDLLPEDKSTLLIFHCQNLA